MIWWTSSSGRIELQILQEDAEPCAVGGRDASPYVDELLTKPYIRKQIEKINPKDIAAELKEYGAWDEFELGNHSDNLLRLMWIVCNDIIEERA